MVSWPLERPVARRPTANCTSQLIYKPSKSPLASPILRHKHQRSHPRSPKMRSQKSPSAQLHRQSHRRHLHSLHRVQQLSSKHQLHNPRTHLIHARQHPITPRSPTSSCVLHHNFFHRLEPPTTTAQPPKNSSPLITIYCGHDTGLEGQTTKSLPGLLEYYQVLLPPTTHCMLVANKMQKKDAQSTPMKAEREGRNSYYLLSQ